VVAAYREARVALPRRRTRLSAGYDLAAAEAVTVEPGRVALVPTGLKVYLPADEHVQIHIRSSLALEHSLILANGVGIVDADYADNPDNEGHILVALRNCGDRPVDIARGQRIAQAIFVPYRRVAGDVAGGEREGGFGSTGRQE